MDNLISLFGLEEMFNKSDKVQTLLDYSKSQNNSTEDRTIKPLKKLIELESPHPDYFLKEMIARVEGEHDIGDRFYEKKNIKSKLYADDRFTEKLAELVHFRQNGKHKGKHDI